MAQVWILRMLELYDTWTAAGESPDFSRDMALFVVPQWLEAQAGELGPCGQARLERIRALTVPITIGPKMITHTFLLFGN